jgi:hypothetical protein
MKQQEVFNKIGVILKELDDQYKYLEADPGKINDLELELFVANTHFLTQNAEVLRKFNIQDHTAKPAEVKQEEKYFEPFAQQPGSPIVADTGTENNEDKPVPDIDIAAAAPGDDYSFIRKEPEVIRHELEIDESWLDDDENEPELTEPEIHVVKDARVKHTADEKPTAKQDEDVLTVNQKMSAQMGNKPVADLGLQPVSDLKAAITLNDKLLFVKDLFNGYSLAYSEAVEILNRFKNFEEADLFLKASYITKHNWESKPDTMEKFYMLLKRRYA